MAAARRVRRNGFLSMRHHYRHTGEGDMDIYEAIYSRRDVRDFRTDPIPDHVLVRILDAAHHAGSVGYMQPWNFVIVRSPEVKRRIYNSFIAENAKAALNYTGERAALYSSLKLAGILEAPVGIAVTCSGNRGGPAVLGRNTMPETDVYSTCCAIQNLWLAGRAEGIGMGWVSILDPATVKQILGIPPTVTLVAYLCLGYPIRFEEEPMLEKVGWGCRLPLGELVFVDAWNQKWMIPSLV
jgi:5,6-dimethylbenzimidazole synthase